MEALFILFGLGIFGVIVAVSVNQQKKRLAAWRSFASSHRMMLRDASAWSNPRMTGKYRDQDVTLQIEVHGSGKHRKTFTRATARFTAAMPRGLNITSEGFTDRLAKLVGGQDIEIGHAELDRQLRIRGEDVPAVLDLMENWRARNAIAAFLARDGQATVTQHQATVLRRGFLSTEAELRGVLENVCRVVREVEQGLGEPDRPPGPRSEPLPSAAPPAVEPQDVERFAWEGQPAPQIEQPFEDLMGELDGVVTVHSSSSEVVSVTTTNSQGGVETFRAAWDESTVSVDEPVITPEIPAVTETPSSAPPSAPAPAPAQADETRPSAAAVAHGDLVPLDDLVALEDRAHSSRELQAMTARLVGRAVALELEVERVSLTMGMGVPQALEGGHTVVGKPAGHPGPRLAVRFPPARSGEVDSLGYGDRLALRGVFMAWDEFYRQGSIHAS